MRSCAGRGTVTIVAIDPGGTTGIALLDSYAGFDSFQVEGSFEEQANALKYQLTALAPDVVVCESFIITPNTGKLSSDEQKYYPLMLIGIIRCWCDTYELEYVAQTPSQRKFATDDKLKRLGWYTPTKGGHANDAARHLLTYLANTNHKETLRRLAA